ncbi:MAG: hypothetical protein ACI9S8_001177 [Chlamydiales bacterium]|jgi:hypothetical protein
MLKNPTVEGSKTEKINKDRLHQVLNKINFQSVKNKKGVGLSTDFKNNLRARMRGEI